MTWDELSRALGVTPDDKGWLRVTRAHGPSPRPYVIQQVRIADWTLALVQTTIAHDTQLGAAEAATRVVRFPLGALALNQGYWLLRQALPLDGLTLERLELVLRCLDVQAREMVPAPRSGDASELFSHYTDD